MARTLTQAGSSLSGVLTVLMLTAIICVGPLWIGAARPWILLPLLLAVWALVGLQSWRLFFAKPGEAARCFDAIDLSVVLFLLYAVGRYFTAPIEYAARMELLSIFAYASVFWIARYGLARKLHGLWLILTLVVVGTVVALIGLATWLNPDLQPYPVELATNIKHYGVRIFGTYGCPNHFGGFLVMTTSLAVAATVFSRLPWTLRIIIAYLVIIFAAAIFLSYSRGSWLGWLFCMVGLAIFAMRHGTVRWWVPVGMFALSLVLGVVVIATSDLATTRVFNALNFADVRVQLAKDSLAIAADYPVFGTGPATFEYIHPRYQVPHFNARAVFNHNDYLNMLTDYGAVGLLLSLLFVGLVTVRLFRYLGAQHEPLDRVMVAGALGAWMALIIHSTVDFNLHIPANALVFFTLVGLGLRETRNSATTGWLATASMTKPLALLALLVTLMVGFVTLQTWRAQWGLDSAERAAAYAPWDYVARLGEESFAIDPGNQHIAAFVADVYRQAATRAEQLEDQFEHARQAEKWYATAHELNPLQDRYGALRGLAYDLMLRHNEAYLLYQQAIANQPNNGFYHKLLGYHLWRRNEVDLARQAFEKGAKLPMGSGPNRVALGELDRILKGEEMTSQQAQAIAEVEAPLVQEEPRLPGFVVTTSDVERTLVPLDGDAAEPVGETSQPTAKLPLPPENEIPKEAYEPEPDDPSQIVP